MRYFHIYFPAWGGRDFWIAAESEREALNKVDYTPWYGDSEACVEEVSEAEYMYECDDGIDIYPQFDE